MVWALSIWLGKGCVASFILRLADGGENLAVGGGAGAEELLRVVLGCCDVPIGADHEDDGLACIGRDCLGLPGKLGSEFVAALKKLFPSSGVSASFVRSTKPELELARTGRW